MIRIEIEGKSIEEILTIVDINITALEKKTQRLVDDLVAERTRTDELFKQNALQADEIIKLQEQIIEQQTEDTKERRSLWDFLTGKNKESEKSSRITESTVTLDK